MKKALEELKDRTLEEVGGGWGLLGVPVFGRCPLSLGGGMPFMAVARSPYSFGPMWGSDPRMGYGYDDGYGALVGGPVQWVGDGPSDWCGGWRGGSWDAGPMGIGW